MLLMGDLKLEVVEESWKRKGKNGNGAYGVGTAEALGGEVDE